MPLGQARHLALVAAIPVIVWLAALPAAPPHPARHSGDTGYLLYLDRHGVRYDSSEDLVLLGHRTCEALRGQVSVVTVGRRIVAEGFDALSAAHIVNAAVGGLCPETAPFVRAQVAEHLPGATDGSAAAGPAGAQSGVRSAV